MIFNVCLFCPREVQVAKWSIINVSTKSTRDGPLSKSYEGFAQAS